MLIAVPSQGQFEKRFWALNLGLYVFALALAVWTLISLLMGADPQFSSLDLSLPAKKQISSYEEIGLGPLALNGMRVRCPVPGLGREIALLGKNTRPDAQDVAILLGLKSAAEERVVMSGETVYVRQDSDRFSFSSEKTPIAITPISLDENSVLIEVRLNEEKGEFILKNACLIPKEIEALAYAKTLRDAKWWGPDILIQNCGGDEYQHLRFKHKIEFSDANVCFIGEGDLLAWEEDQWRHVSSDTISPFLPLARVAAITPRGIELQAWDESGFYPMNVKISSQQLPKGAFKLEEIFSSMRPRTASRLSCLLGKRRVVLKEGDWWLKTPAKWHNLKTVSEIEDFLQHKIQGELFIFDQMDTEKGKIVMKGRLFDTMRTQMTPVALAVSSEKKTSIASRKSSKHGSASSVIAKSEDKPVRVKLPQFQSSDLEEKKP